MEHAKVEAVPEKRRGRKRKINNVQNVVVGHDGKKKVAEIRSLKFVGRYVRKEFQGNGVFLGRITSDDSGLYRVDYEDGDFEDLDSGEVKVFLVEDEDLTGEWSKKKHKLDKLLLSKDTNEKVLKVDGAAAEQESVKQVDSSLLSEVINGDAGADKAVEVRADDNGNADADVDSSNDSCEDTSEEDVNVDVEVLLPPCPELPPSSGHIGIPEEYVSLLFSVHSFLRSFSVPLFLYPFGIDDFVGALNCSVANTLLDSIHVALLRALKRHFERLSSDGSELASKCLRCLDWSLLDSLTWPIYLVHYLMLLGYTNGPDWKGFYSHSLERDYYTLSAGKKLIVLQMLCDDVLDSEELRTEIDTREESEVGVDIDSSTVVATTDAPRRVHPRYSKTSACKDIQNTLELLDAKSSLSSLSMGSQAGEPVSGSVDEDGNGDECRLCGMDGFLLCCDGCPFSYHSRCLGLNKTFMPDGSWYCPECKINATEPQILRGTALKGGDNIGVDPYEQVFVATCDHLLVLKASINNITCVRYYNRHDIPGVLHALCSKPEHAVAYATICRGIIQYWELPQDILPSNEMSEVGLRLAHKVESAGFVIENANLLDKSDAEMTEVENAGNCVVMAAPSLTNSVQEPVLSGNSVTMTKSDRLGTVDSTKRPSEGCSYMGSFFKPTGYINYYLHGDFAAAAAANLAVLTSEENHLPKSHTLDNGRKVMSASVSLQVKAFSSAAIRFFWPHTEKKLIETRERCSWCLSCKAPVSSRRGCLLNAAASNAIKGAMRVLAGGRPMKNGELRVSGIATYIMFMEESLSGLLVGPFLNDTFRKKWRKEVEQATTCNTLKILLLELEENIRTIAHSGDWTKLAEGLSTQSSTSQTAATAAGSTQKRRPGRRGKKAASTIEVAADDSQDILTDFTWWRGGMLSKLMFQRWILPCPMIRKAARQGGSKQISGIHYAEGHETPKISKQLLWRLAVEMSRNTAQLALQVRYLDFHLRWGDLVRPEQTPADGKGPEAEASAFRNAFICDKKIVEHEIRYCVAFRSQKHLPSRVLKSIIETEQSSDDGSERYWFSETRIPLYLIKEYEEKLEKNKPDYVLSKLQRRMLKASRKNIFSSLFWKQDILSNRYCCSCRQDVFYRNAVKCTSCQGFCHEQCSTSSTVRMNNEVGFLVTCKRCCENQAKTRVAPSNGYTISPLHLERQDLANSDTTKKPLKLVIKKGPSTLPVKLEHSSELKSKSRSAVAKKNSKILHWGLIWRKQNAEDTGINFRLKNILLSGNPNRNLMAPRCRLCKQPYNADLTYIRCETCQHWFHADALEFDESKIAELVGYKCCKCRRIRAPTCPYMDPEKKKVLEDKIARTRPAKLENSEMDFDSGISSEYHKEEGPPTYSSLSANDEVIHVAADDPLLVSLSEVDQFTENKSEADYGFSNGPGPRKLPVRRYIKQERDANLPFQADPFQVDLLPPFETNVSNSTEKLPIRRHVKKENDLDMLSPQVQWIDHEQAFEDGASLDFDDCVGYEDMEFEPQTYFSFNELLASDDGGDANGNGLPVVDWENPSGLADDGTLEISYDQGEPIISVETDIQIEPCNFCSNIEPCPDLSCQTCGIWIHSHCSPWVESSSSLENGWRCGNCREWR